MMRFLMINGPNLNLLGTREPEIYGSTTLPELEDRVTTWGESLGADVECEQSNDERRIIELIQSFDGDGIVLNPAAFSHTSRAIADAIGSVPVPVVEVHISNIRAREAWRRQSVVSETAVRTIYGRGLEGYKAALRHLVNRHAIEFETVRYGPHDDNVGDVRRGGGDLVVLIHGGLWRQEHERDGMESLAVDLPTHGYDTWNIEYRRLGTGGGWPASAHDVLTAFDFIPRLDTTTDRVTVVSHSAGSLMATWAAERSRTPIDLHVALAPILDLEATIDNEDLGAGEARALMSAGAPAMTVPGKIETVIVHGDADQIVPVERSVALASEHGLVHHRTGCDHFSLINPTTPEWAWVVDRLAPAQ
jgi:3-dehydroquinate dehydratase-2